MMPSPDLRGTYNKNCVKGFFGMCLMLAVSCGDISHKTHLTSETAPIQNESFSYIVTLQDPGKGGRSSSLNSTKNLLSELFHDHNNNLKSYELLSLTHEDIGKNNPAFAISRIDFIDGKNALEVLTKEQKEGRILFFEPNHIQHLFTNSHSTSRSNEDDPLWWRKKINYPSPLYLQNSGLDSPGKNAPIIAVLDSGIDYTHIQLKEVMWKNNSPGNYGCLNDRYGCDVTEDVPSYLGKGNALPFRTSSPGEDCPLDMRGFLKSDCYHGTHIAGIIASHDNGLCATCKIINVKVVQEIDGVGKVLDSSILKALEYIKRLKASGLNIRVVNSSYGSFFKSKAIALVTAELQKENILFVAASGNENSERRVYPAAYKHVISVAALAKSGKKARYSNFGSWIDILAPGGDTEQNIYYGIYSTVPGGEHHTSQGTSMAAPIISGVAGLLLRKDPALSASALRQRILHAASPSIYGKEIAEGYNYNFFYRTISSRGTRQPLLGSGLIDVTAALEGSRKNDFDFSTEAAVTPVCGETTEAQGKNSYLVGFLFLIPLSFRFLMRRTYRWRFRRKK